MNSKYANEGNGYGAINPIQLHEKRSLIVDADQISDNRNERRSRSLLSLAAIVLFVVGIVTYTFNYSRKFHRHDISSASSAILPSKLVVPREGDEDEALWYADQLVDHTAKPGTKHYGKTFSQKYFVNDKHFAGPGSPIIMIIGGEGESKNLYYPYVFEYLAKSFGAYTIQAEHRFYGQSDPVEVVNNEDMIGLLTVENAMQDFLQILDWSKENLNCSNDRSSKEYCPTITVGASYPGFLSALMRIVHPEKVDIAYASSAPLNLYSQNVDSHDYYNLVTRVAESASGGCSKAVKETLMEVHSLISSSNDLSAEMTKLNICTETFPDYIKTTDLLASELMAIVGQNFAFFNMFDYPPGPATLLNQACNIFQNSSLSPYEKMDQFFHLVPVANELQPSECGFDISIQIPAGRDATISTSDWTGSGFGKTGRSWDFHCCTELIVQTGFSEISMFYPKEWSLDWLTEHCQKRFGVSPAPYKLVNNYSFDDLSNVSRILFTNGLKDGWSESSIKESPNENIVVINMPNGAHHSELSRFGPSDKDTDDVEAAFFEVEKVLSEWLNDIKSE